MQPTHLRGAGSPRRGYKRDMKIAKTAAALGIAKKLATEARKPENQAKIKAGAEKLKNRTRGRRQP